ncbi:hypothetical protein [Piscinibacter sp. XHJ-5]|uniref:hypothetical protein n=1 Tax=Piscinibacter sp. XHJ-5 TaxID=3037797 RepID=UPI002453719F|nr:hypothetical protein [Piscinibacter sp. XHJ-5]
MTLAAHHPPRRRLLAGLLALGASVPALGGTRVLELVAQASVPGTSEAERLLFMQPHLANVEPPRTLRYRYVNEGLPEGRVVDRATLELTRGADGKCCAVRADYLSGDRAMRLPDIPEARANPVLLYFLEQQVRQLQARTRGSAAHFRRRARLALADAATVTHSTVRWGGADLPARSVRIAPYVDDPYRERFAMEAATEYTFVVSDAVPGVIFQLRATVPGTQPVREETLTLESAEPYANEKR